MGRQLQLLIVFRPLWPMSRRSGGSTYYGGGLSL